MPFEGPPKNEFYSMDCLNGKLAISGGVLDGIEPSFSLSGLYLFEDEKWTLKDPGNMGAWDTITIHDFLATSINPMNTDEVAVSTFSLVPYLF